MDFWTAIVAIVAIAIPFEFVKYAIKIKHQKKEEMSTDSEEKLEKLTRRVESLESIIIDLEKDRRYRDLK